MKRFRKFFLFASMMTLLTACDKDEPATNAPANPSAVSFRASIGRMSRATKLHLKMVMLLVYLQYLHLQTLA